MNTITSSVKIGQELFDSEDFKIRNNPEQSLYPGDDYNKRLVEWIAPEEWMVECLKMNPNYTSWGPYEEYMSKNDDGGWDNPMIFKTWKEFGPLKLDKYNEIVNFYFEIERKSEPCEFCGESGLNENAKIFHETWECNNETICENTMTQIALDALWEHDFLKKKFKAKPTLEEFIAWSVTRQGNIELSYLISCELNNKNNGYFSHCKKCKGHRRNFTEPEAKLGLVLWILHPRRGCSRGFHIKKIQREELPNVVKLLQEAAQRNSDRFSKLILPTYN